MESKINRVTVEIYGEEYTIRGTEKAEYMEKTARIVDEKMKEIGSKLSSLSISRVAVLAALNLADELLKAEETNNRLTGMLEKEWERRKDELARSRKADAETAATTEEEAGTEEAGTIDDTADKTPDVTTEEAGQSPVIERDVRRGNANHTTGKN